jgi:hypothetical protein
VSIASLKEAYCGGAFRMYTLMICDSHTASSTTELRLPH